MWSDQDQSRAFGGRLAWKQSPFYSHWRDIRRIICDLPVSQDSYGPAWMLAGVQLPAALAAAGPDDYIGKGTKLLLASAGPRSYSAGNSSKAEAVVKRSVAEVLGGETVGAALPGSRRLLWQ